MSGGERALSIVAVDTGGTFTDVVAVIDGRLRSLKLPSTPDDPSSAVLRGLAEIGVPSPFVLVHGSTVATNALLERTGARVALVTNDGFQDVIEIGRQDRPQLYGLAGHRPPPLVSREDRIGIRGRIGADGAEIEPLDQAEIERLAGRLAEHESLAVCLLHSYAAPEHERSVAAALAPLGLPLSVSSDLLPEYREYERTATTVVNAYVAPRMDRYLARLEAGAGAQRVRVMGSSGGAVPIETARRHAVHTILSGPAGGVAGALAVGRRMGKEHLLTFDMGGTSTDVSLCPGRPLHTREYSVAGLPVAVPVLDIHTVGAGGGSLAWVDAAGSLRVGPRSAGADPGPVCYGAGGTQITVTDAHVWLGRLPPAAFLGGARRLDRAAVDAPLGELAARVGLSKAATAEGILAVADTAMEGALRVISVERGYDPIDFVLMPFGGAGALHAVELASRLGVPRVIVPPEPGVLSALGMLASPVRREASRTVLVSAGPEPSTERPAAGGEPAAEGTTGRDGSVANETIRSVFAELEERARAFLQDEGVPVAEVRRWVDARYPGQSFELRVPAESWVDAFHAAHRARYGHARADVVEAVTLRVEAVGATPELPWPHLVRAAGTVLAAGSRDRVIYRGEALEVPIHARAALAAGHRVPGPAIVTDYSATTWLPPGWRLEVHGSGCLLLERV